MLVCYAMDNSPQSGALFIRLVAQYLAQVLMLEIIVQQYM